MAFFGSLNIFILDLFFFAQFIKDLLGSYFFGQPIFKLNENLTDASIKLLRTLLLSPIQQIFNDPKKAVLNSDVIFSDKFIGLYDKKNKRKKLQDFKNFQVNSNLMKFAKKNAIFLHCLPALRGQEVSAEVLDGKQSRVWQQALNRLHVQKSILLYCLEKLR